MRLWIPLLAIFLLSCSTTAPPRTEYFLRHPVSETDAAQLSQPRVGLQRVALAPYLKQRGLAIETAANELRPAQSHVWAEPLDEGLLLFLRGALAAALQEDVGITRSRSDAWDQRVEVYVEQLHGTMSGNALLVASFKVTGSEESAVATQFRFARSRALAADGYASLVEAEKQLVGELAAAIAAAVTSLR